MLAFQKHPASSGVVVLLLIRLVNSQSCPSCLNGGTCAEVLNSPGQYLCQCPSSWQGLDCSVAAPPASSPTGNSSSATLCGSSGSCLHGGSCGEVPNSPGQYQCNCPSGWQGVDCSIASGAAPSPSPKTNDSCGGCLNGALCQQAYNSPGDYSCQCKSGWSGVLCDVRTSSSSPPTASPARTTSTSCGSLTCNNNGTCISVYNSPGSYQCSCKPGWKGIDCTLPNVAPASSPSKASGPSSSSANSKNSSLNPEDHGFPRKYSRAQAVAACRLLINQVTLE